MNMLKHFMHCARIPTASFALVLVLANCIPRPPGGGAGNAAAGPSAEVSAEGKACGADGVLDDGEDNNNQVLAQKGRGGYWYTFADKSGTTITPMAGAAGGTFSMSPGGANGSQFAARINGKVAASGTVFGGMGFNFADPKAAFDVSTYKGISFWARRGETSTGSVRVKLPDVNTDQDGRTCTECFNDFGVDLELTTTWTKYTVIFSWAQQMPGWGAPRPAAVESSKMYGVQWQVNAPGADYDISIDDIQFTGCP
jgi:endoglucanase